MVWLGAHGSVITGSRGIWRVEQALPPHPTRQCLRVRRGSDQVAGVLCLPLGGAAKPPPDIPAISGFLDVLDVVTIGDRVGVVEAHPAHGMPPPDGVQRSPADRLRYTIQLAEALGRLHARGLALLDLSPARLSLSPDERDLQISGLGLALLGAGPPTSSTPFSAPELAHDSATPPDRVLADVYSAGAVITWLYTGRPPEQEHANPALPASLTPILRRCLAEDPPDRYPNGQALAQALRDASIPQAHPAPPTSSPPPVSSDRTGTAQGIGIRQEDGRGFILHIEVRLLPGRGQVETTAHTLSESTRRAVHTATRVALGPHADRLRVLWAARCDPIEAIDLDGASLGLPIAMACRAALLERAVPSGLFFTGSLGVDGRIGPVSSLPEKLRAIAQDAPGPARVMIPPGATPPATPGLHTLPVSTWCQATAIALPHRSWRHRLALIGWAAALLLPLLLLLWPGRAGLDELIWTPLLRAAGPLSAENTVIIALPATHSLREERPHYPELLDTLSRLGAKAATLDVLLLRGREGEDDGSIARIEQAIGQLQGTLPVVLVTREPCADHIAKPTAAWSARTGHDCFAASADDRHSVALVITQGLHHHAAIETVAASLHQPIRVDAHRLLIGDLSNPAYGRAAPDAFMQRHEAAFIHLRPVDPATVLSLPADTPQTWPTGALRGRIAIIARTDEARHGMAYVSAIETLLAQAAPQVLSNGSNALLGLLTWLATLLLSRAVPPHRRHLARWAPGLPLLMALGAPLLGWLVGLVPLVAQWILSSLAVNASLHPDAQLWTRPSSALGSSPPKT